MTAAALKAQGTTARRGGGRCALWLRQPRRRCAVGAAGCGGGELCNNWLRALFLGWGARRAAAVERTAQDAVRRWFADARDDAAMVDAPWSKGWARSASVRTHEHDACILGMQEAATPPKRDDQGRWQAQESVRPEWQRCGALASSRLKRLEVMNTGLLTRHAARWEVTMHKSGRNAR